MVEQERRKAEEDKENEDNDGIGEPASEAELVIERMELTLRSKDRSEVIIVNKVCDFYLTVERQHSITCTNCKKTLRH